MIGAVSNAWIALLGDITEIHLSSIIQVENKALWQELTDTEKYDMRSSPNCVIKHTAILMKYGMYLYQSLQYSSIKVAASQGWSGAVCAWIGIRDDRLNNVVYVEEFAKPDTPYSVYRYSVTTDNTKYIAAAILHALYAGHLKVLQYLPDIDVSKLFHHVFPDARVPIKFIRKLIYIPTEELMLNGNLREQLDRIGHALLMWLPVTGIQKLVTEARQKDDENVIHYVMKLLRIDRGD
ncbi:unnamed protein product [Thelazia callipaeda]|uniref:FGGY_N domain-containing protein n=1 Tax=Thelazia callipaeda TaxID=103827 RepID=A0A0N5CRZ8_THECL|nr:unnamed protein product [Thelazia callipaeda]